MSIQKENKPSIQKEKIKDQWIQIRVNKNTKTLLNDKAKQENKSLSQYILESVLTPKQGSVNTLDTQILKKMIKPFIERGITLDLDEGEIIRIKQLWEETKNA